MARSNLKDLGSLLSEGTTTAAPPPDAPAPARTPKQAAESGGAATYLDFVKKDTRLRPDQAEEIEALGRQLNRAKTTTKTPRITANTVVRVAIDLLLARSDELQGDTEDALRKSLGL